MDRVLTIMEELAKCQPAHFTNGGRDVEAVYLDSESIGVILCQTTAMRLEIEELEIEVIRLRINNRTEGISKEAKDS